MAETNAEAEVAEETLDKSALYAQYAHPLRGTDDLNLLVERGAQTRVALLGEASHGTREFYTWRAKLSQRLITEAGYRFVALEADWLSIARVNRVVQGHPDADSSVREALEALDHWPHWMWANEEFLEFAEWLQEWNKDRPEEERVGIYGFDVYAPWKVVDMILEYFAEQDPALAERFHEKYEVFLRYRGDPQRYARAAGFGIRSAEAEVRAARDLAREHWDSLQGEAREAAFAVKQGAALVAGAERFFGTMGGGGAESWNHRVDHMKGTVTRLLNRYGEDSRGIVWAHNTHVGDARATIMHQYGQRNIGQLARQRWGREAVLVVGFSTYQGEVLAARQWDGRRETMSLVPASEGSFDATLEAMGRGDALVLFPPAEELPEALREPLGHRAVGVIFHPERESRNYVPTVPALRYDAILYLRETSPLHPLHP